MILPRREVSSASVLAEAVAVVRHCRSGQNFEGKWSAPAMFSGGWCQRRSADRRHVQ